MRLFLLFCLSLISLYATAQKYTLNGIITDKATGAPIVGAIVNMKSSGIGAATDIDGAFSFVSPAITDTLQVQYYGFKPYRQLITVTADRTFNIALEEEINAVDAIVIESSSNYETLEKTQMSTVEITAEEARLIPSIGGEVDMLKILQLKPGIKNGGEGSAGLYVRGGGPDQNLFLMDGAQVYNPSHLFGFFSIFNSDAVKNIELYKGDFPPKYAGRLSSVVDVRMRTGDTSKLHARGGIGVISSRFTLEGPFNNKKGSFLISGRRTYFDIFTRMINKSQENNINYNRIPDYFFWDLNGKINYRFNDKNSMSFTSYYGKDKFKFNDDLFKFNFNWGNFVNVLSWNHDYSRRLSSTVSLIHSSYRYTLTNSSSGFALNLQSQIKDYTVKGNFLYIVNDKHTLEFGATATLHDFLVSRLNAGSNDGKIKLNAGQHLYAQEYGVYVSDQYTISARLKVQGGIRFSAFSSNQIYSGWEPRVSARYKLNERQSIKASYARMFQYVHLASNSGASLPTDLWYPSTVNVKPQISDQVALGHQIILWRDKLFFTNEIYYKYMQHVIDFRDGAQLFVNNNLEGEFVFGKGYSYGWETYLEKKKGRTTGWIGYTLSWTWRQFDAINQGNLFPARYDRRHDISIVLIHKLSSRVSLSATWVYGTGNAISLPVGRILVQDVLDSNPTIVPVYTDRNAFRMPSYHRMDLGLIYQLKPKWGEADLTLSIYNVYNRKNAYFIYFKEVRNSYGVITNFAAKQVALFPVIPSLTFNFRF